MKYLDRTIRDIRIGKARRFLRPGDRLLDIGCVDQTFLKLVTPMVKRAAGIDPLAEPSRDGKLEVVKGTIPGEHPFKEGEFDCITLLAAMERITDKEALAKECFRLLAPGGRVILTVPHPLVDTILAGLVKLGLVEGTSIETRHAFDPRQTPGLFASAGFRLGQAESFEFGLNRLFVMEKPRTWPARVEFKPTPVARPSSVSTTAATVPVASVDRSK